MACPPLGTNPLWAAVFSQIDQYAHALMSTGRYPGLAVGLTDRQHLLWTGCYGCADMAARTPVTPETLFEIGSIGKSFTAVALLQLQEEGRLDVHAPVSRYLPWFQVKSDFAPITLHHLLSHTSGIVRGTDFSPESFGEVWALRDLPTVYAPGTHLLYSNTGFKALGLVLEAVGGEPYERAIRRRVLDRLGMDSTAAVISQDTRPRLATGYRPFYEDRPHDLRRGYSPATFFETATGDGCIASNVVDMCAYVRMYLNHGNGAKARALSNESFDQMTQGVAVYDAASGSRYGYGIVRSEKDGHTYLEHGGGMVGYLSHIRLDLLDGFGVALFVNGPEKPLELCDYSLALLSAALRGQSLPAAPAVKDRRQIEKAAEYAGDYVGPAGTLSLEAASGGLLLHHDGEAAPLETVAPDYFLVSQPGFERFLLHAERDGGQVVSLGFGPDRYTRSPAAPDPDVPPLWRAYVGHYRSYNPWYSNFRVVLRGGKLIYIYPQGIELELVPLDAGLFRLGEEVENPERIQFRAVVDGKAQIATHSGLDFYRAFSE